jgi:integrase
MASPYSMTPASQSRSWRRSTPACHALSHFFCSWCAARPQDGGLGLPLKTVQVRMGHSTLAMTADRYGHLVPSQDDAEVLATGERALMGA